MQSVAELDEALGALAMDLEALSSALPTGSPAWLVLATVYEALTAASMQIINLGADLAHSHGRPTARAVRRSLKRVRVALKTMQQGLDVLTTRYCPQLPAGSLQRLQTARQRVPGMETTLRIANTALSSA